MLNKYYEPVPDVAYSTSEFKENLLTGTNTLDIWFRISGHITVAGGANDLTLRDDAIFRLLDSLTLEHDGTKLVDGLSGRELAELSRRLFVQTFSNTVPANLNSGLDQDFAVSGFVPIRRRYMMRPAELYIPPLPTRQFFGVRGNWNKERVNAGSSQGSYAFSTGGTDTITLSDVKLEMVQVVAPQMPNGNKPLFIPTISTDDSIQWSAANGNLEFDLKNDRAIDATLISIRDAGADDDYADLLNAVTLQAGSSRFINDVSAQFLHEFEQAEFPAVGDSPVGNYFFLWADGGLVGNALEPSAMVRPRMFLDVDAPSSGPAYARFVHMELMSKPGYTLGGSR